MQENYDHYFIQEYISWEIWVFQVWSQMRKKKKVIIASE